MGARRCYVANAPLLRPTASRCPRPLLQDKEMVERLLDLKSRLDEVVAGAFGRSEAFAATLKESFEYFINQVRSGGRRRGWPKPGYRKWRGAGAGRGW